VFGLRALASSADMLQSTSLRAKAQAFLAPSRFVFSASVCVLRAGQGLRRTLSVWLLNPPCIACAAARTEFAEALGADFCAACSQQLPWLEQACVRCGEFNPARDANGQCPACLRKRPLVETLRAAFRYERPISDLLLQFKHRSDLAAGRALCALAAEKAAHWPRPDVLIPVPLHADRLRERGFDQAYLLARDLAQSCRLPVQRALQRMRATPSQAGLSASERRRNVQGAFASASLSGLHISLVDDVATTASTLNACALACRRAGAKRVDAWVIARA
jgi:ComF family protein